MIDFFHNRPKTRDEWCEYMLPKIYFNGRLAYNAYLTIDNKLFVEFWDTGEVIEVNAGDELTFIVSPDVRFIPNGNRSYTDVMHPEYLAIGADKWEPWTEAELNARWPKRPGK